MKFDRLSCIRRKMFQLGTKAMNKASTNKQFALFNEVYMKKDVLPCQRALANDIKSNETQWKSTTTDLWNFSRPYFSD